MNNIPYIELNDSLGEKIRRHLNEIANNADVGVYTYIEAEEHAKNVLSSVKIYQQRISR